MSLVFVPLYIKFMGIESYGLVGIFASLFALFGLLDMGLSTTLNRELARLSAVPDRAGEMRNLVRTLEIIYWGMAVVIGIADAVAVTIGTVNSQGSCNDYHAVGIGVGCACGVRAGTRGRISGRGAAA